MFLYANSHGNNRAIDISNGWWHAFLCIINEQWFSMELLKSKKTTYRQGRIGLGKFGVCSELSRDSDIPHYSIKDICWGATDVGVFKI